MSKINLNRKLFAIHSWLGLFLGIFFLLISISGAISVFRFELNSLIYGRKMDYKLEKNRKRLSYDTIFSIAKKDFPAMPYYVCGFDEVYKNKPAFFSGVDHVEPQLFTTSMQYRVNNLNPYTGERLLEANSNGKNNIIDWIMGFHYSLAFGEGGELFVVLLDFALLASLITGFIFYRKHIIKVLTFKEKIKFSNWRLATSGLHRVVGVWALLFNFLIFGSGIYYQKKFFVEKWWDKYTHTTHEAKHQHHKIQYPLSGISLDSLRTIAVKKFPSMKFDIVSVNSGEDGSITAFGTAQESMFFAYGNYALVNFDSAGRFTNTVYTPWEKLSASEKFDNINFSLFHTGWALGTVGKTIWCIMGFTPAFLSITGFLLWYRKRKTQIKHS